MTVYNLAHNVTVSGNGLTPAMHVALSGGAETQNNSAVDWTHHCWVQSGNASVSATISPVGSNDPAASQTGAGNWISTGTPATVTAAANGAVGQATITGTALFQRHGVLVSISGTGGVYDYFAA